MTLKPEILLGIKMHHQEYLARDWDGITSFFGGVWLLAFIIFGAVNSPNAKPSHLIQFAGLTALPVVACHLKHLHHLQKRDDLAKQIDNL